MGNEKATAPRCVFAAREITKLKKKEGRDSLGGGCRLNPGAQRREVGGKATLAAYKDGAVGCKYID